MIFLKPLYIMKIIALLIFSLFLFAFFSIPGFMLIGFIVVIFSLLLSSFIEPQTFIFCSVVLLSCCYVAGFCYAFKPILNLTLDPSISKSNNLSPFVKWCKKTNQ